MNARWAVVIFDRSISDKEAEDARDALRSFYGVSVVGPIVTDETPVKPPDLSNRAPTPSQIIWAAGRAIGVVPDAIISKTRSGTIVRARHIAMYLIRQRLMLSYPEIGSICGNRDHTTVMAAVKKIKTLLEYDERTKAEIADIETDLAERSAAA